LGRIKSPAARGGRHRRRGEGLQEAGVQRPYSHEESLPGYREKNMGKIEKYALFIGNLKDFALLLIVQDDSSSLFMHLLLR
jgi:hypothetical protein